MRVEFFGDEIESIRRFDSESQRSIHKLSECTLQPLTEFQTSRPLLAEAGFGAADAEACSEIPGGEAAGACAARTGRWSIL